MHNDVKDSDHELLSQYIDDELPVVQAQELRRRLLAEPGLRADYEQLRKVDNDIRETFNAPGTESVPSRISALLQNERSGSRRARWGFAIAASLLAATGLLLNSDWQPTGTGAAPLTAALDNSPSGTNEWVNLEDGRKLQPVLSFAHVNGSWCREFMLLDNDRTYRGVACRSEGHWVTSVMSNQPLPGATSEYRPAGANDSDDVAAFIAGNAAGIPLSRRDENKLIARRWR